ncbi:MAG: parallel beta-helix domain-containing protein [Chloroflexota bacterium]
MNKALKWIGGIVGGLAALLVVIVLVLGVLPVAEDVPPKPLPSEIGAPTTAPTVRPVESGRTITVNAGDSIQAAIDEAKPGDTIEVMPGTYHESLTVTAHNITLRGLPDAAGAWPILDGESAMDNGAFVIGSFFTIEQFQIRNYTENGVITQGTYGPVYRDLVVDNPGEYAVFPIASTNVLIERVKATGATDSALYVGQSRDVVVRDSEAYLSVTGIEIENSVNALVENNYVHDNTAGILVFLLPNKNAKEGHNTTVINNRVENNNTPNFATDGIVQDVPPGIGILVLIADGTEVTGNTISGNNSVGVGVVAATIFFDDVSDFDIPLIPEQTWLHDNTYSKNGAKPADFLVKAGLPGVDVLWDASGWDNRFDDQGVKGFPILPSSAWPDVLKKAVWRALQALK